MKFLHPAFLFALLAIAIPVLIHLFSFRRYKTVYFSHVGFLKGIKKESQKKSRLKQLLMLAARILTILFLVLAFARPYIPGPEETPNATAQMVGVYIDNSFSMNALSEQGQLLEQARNRAVEIAQTYPPGTKFRLFTNDMRPQHQHLLNNEQFISQVTDIHISPRVIPLSMIHNHFLLQNQDYGEERTAVLYFLSDFQRNLTDPDHFNKGPVKDYFLPLIPAEVSNLYIDSCWMEVPAHGLNQEEQIFVKIKNHSDEDYQNLPLNLYLNDSLKSITNFSVEAQDEIVTTLKYTNVSGGIQRGRIEVTDYPFTHDNTWYISYFVEPKLKALAITGQNPAAREGAGYISALFRNDDYVDLDLMDLQSLQISKLSDYNTIFLINPEKLTTGFLNELHKTVEKGSSVVLFPRMEDDNVINNLFLSTFNATPVTGADTTTQEISGINFDHRFFEDVFLEKEENPILPKTDRHLKFRENIRTAESNLLWFQNGDKALSVLPYGRGKVWIFAFPLDETTSAFARDILFVPSVYNIVINSISAQKISYTLGADHTSVLPRSYTPRPDESPPEIENVSTGDRFIPGLNITEQGTRLDLTGLIETAGHYRITAGERTISTISFNYDRKESALNYYSPGELREELEGAGLKNAAVTDGVDKNFSKIFSKLQKGEQLWKWALLLALFFLLSEALIARFYKR